MSKENIAVKYTTDSPSTAASSISSGQPDACQPGELVLSAQSGAARILTIDANGDGVIAKGVLSNENKGSFTVSSYGEGPSSMLLNANSVTETKVANNSVGNDKIASPVLIAKGGTGQATSNTALNTLLPSQSGNQNKLLTSNGSSASWVKASLSIDQLNDVNTSSATSLDGQLLKWDATATQWKQRESVTTFSDELPTSQSSGRLGQIALGEDYFYACHGYNQWARTPLQPWSGDGAILRSPVSEGYVYTCEPLVFGGDPYYLNVTLLLHMNGTDLSTTITDTSSAPVTMTRGGNTSIRTATKKFGSGSCYFDGSGDYLYTPPSAGFDLIGSNFTAEAWIYPLSYNVTGTRIFAGGGGGVTWNSTSGIHWLVQFDGNGKLAFEYWNGSTAVGWSTAAGAPLSTWSHVAISISGSTVYMAVNGVVESFPVTGITRPSSTPAVAIATLYGENGGGGYAYQGYMDEVRITKGVARYISNFNVPPGEFGELGYSRDIYFNNVSLLLHADGQNGSSVIRDYSLNGLSISSKNNAQISTSQSKFGGSSLFLNGVGSYLSLSNDPVFQFGNGDFTIEFWFYAESFPAGSSTILGSGNTTFSGGEGTYAWYIMVSGSPRKLRMGAYNSNPNISSTTTINTGTWYHAAISRQGGTVRMWVDGIYQTASGNSSNYNISNNGLLIGKNGWDGTVGLWHGYIDDLRITKGVSRYSTSNVNITVPTSPYLDAW